MLKQWPLPKVGAWRSWFFESCASRSKPKPTQRDASRHDTKRNGSLGITEATGDLSTKTTVSRRSWRQLHPPVRLNHRYGSNRSPDPPALCKSGNPVSVGQAIGSSHTGGSVVPMVVAASETRGQVRRSSVAPQCGHELHSTYCRVREYSARMILHTGACQKNTDPEIDQHPERQRKTLRKTPKQRLFRDHGTS